MNSSKGKTNEFATRVYKITRRIPKGSVATYAIVARAIRNPQAVRAVGNSLNKNPFKNVPCHRVIRSDGMVGGFARGAKEKIKILRREGVKIIHNNRVAHSNVLKNIRMST